MTPEIHQSGKSPTDVCDEALFLLRNAPLSIWACYIIGTAPFLLALLYFWSEMTRGIMAQQKLVAQSLGLTVLFLWMKALQGVFALRLRSRLCFQEQLPVTVRGLARIAFAQARYQPWGLFLIPVSLLLTLPAGWVYAYYQNLTALASPDRSPTSAHARAVEQARLWPKQNHLLLLWLSLMAGFVFLNIIIFMLAVPQILITFFGVKEIFQPSIWLLANTTFLAVAGVLTHMVVDPFIKAVYVVRCFYGEARSSGEDLKVQLSRAIQARSGRAQAIAASAVLFFSINTASAAEAPVESTATVLDEQITDVLSQPEYNWRLPRELIDRDEGGWLDSFFTALGTMLQNAVEAMMRWIRAIREWWRSVFGKPDSSPSSAWSLGDPSFLLYLALALVAGAAIILLWRNRNRMRRTAPVIVEASPAAVDLRDENVAADQLPDDEWLKLAQQLFGEGNLRLAIRALFLAALAHLSMRQFLALARFKSNREYECELGRRAAAIPGVASSFSSLVASYERIWYGMYEPSSELYAECEAIVRELKSC